MGDEIFSVIKKASVFLIGAQLILHLKPNGMYEKYLKFIVHLMALTLFMMPLLKLFGQTDETAFSQSLAGYEEMMQEDMMQINYICDLSEEKRQEIYTREIKSKLNNIYSENNTAESGNIEDEGQEAAGNGETQTAPRESAVPQEIKTQEAVQAGQAGNSTEPPAPIETVEIEVKVHEGNP